MSSDKIVVCNAWIWPSADSKGWVGQLRPNGGMTQADTTEQLRANLREVAILERALPDAAEVIVVLDMGYDTQRKLAQ